MDAVGARRPRGREHRVGVEVGAATDPLTDRPIVRRADDEQSLIREHFSPSELRRPTQLRLRVAVRLGVWLAFIVALIVAMGATSGETQMNVITLGAILCAGGEPCALEPTAQAALRPPRGRAAAWSRSAATSAAARCGHAP